MRYKLYDPYLDEVVKEGILPEDVSLYNDYLLSAFPCILIPYLYNEGVGAIVSFKNN